MNKNKFLKYSSIENMKELRAAFNNGENLEKNSPIDISIKHALNDVEYFQFIIEQGYSGYTYFNKKDFNRAFENITIELSSIDSELISTKSFSDIISKHLSFLTDGHLTISCNGYINGFYKKFNTYVADIVVKELNNEYVNIDTNEKVNISSENLRLEYNVANIGMLFGIYQII